MPQLLFLCTLSKKNLKSIFITNLKERFPIPNILNNNVKYVPLPSQQIALVLLYFYSVYNNSKELYYRIVKINLDPSSEKEVLQNYRALRPRLQNFTACALLRSHPDLIPVQFFFCIIIRQSLELDSQIVEVVKTARCKTEVKTQALLLLVLLLVQYLY